MDEALFERALTPLAPAPQIGDRVLLVTVPSGTPPESYQLVVRITGLNAGHYVGEVVDTDAIEPAAQPGKYHPGQEVIFLRDHVQGLVG
ncbi:hypothetical protein CYR40_16560 [Chimaeribacter arupi]|nr:MULTISPECIES: hypothetical protein [Yersiniaceae]MBS0967670.1 hypothetical protein [Nissabacter archeti]PLR39052.1 hypothetical protein CYR23_03120 [Chimaeribacter arupi]PLR43952.1 hypothetical protein CYR40_16560 [Chimaeribacter arupi]WKZ93631.1 hypothetical protein P0E69_06970 [Chimaeribacter arupi]